MYKYDYTPEQLQALIAEANRLKGIQKYPKPQPGQSLLDAQPPAGGATFNLPPASGPADVVNAPVDIAPRKPQPGQSLLDARATSDISGVDKPLVLSPQVLNQLKASQRQPPIPLNEEYGNAAPVIGTPAEQPGLLRRLGRGLVGALKGGVKEGLSAIELGGEGYKSLKLQERLMPLQKELIKHQQEQEQLYATPQATPKSTTGDLERQYLESLSPEERNALLQRRLTPPESTTGDLERQYLESLSPEERNALLKRRLTPSKSLQEQIDELTAGKPQPITPVPSSSITTPTTATVPTMTPTAPVNDQNRDNDAKKNATIQELKKVGYNDTEIAETLKLLGY